MQLALAAALLLPAVGRAGPGTAGDTTPTYAGKISNVRAQRDRQITQADREAAARRAALPAASAALPAATSSVLQRAAKAALPAGTSPALQGAAKPALSAGTATAAGAMKVGTLGAGSPSLLLQQVPVGVAPPGPGDVPDYFTVANWAFSPPLRKFVDGLPGLGAASANNLGQYLTVAVPDTTTYPGSDYYEIELRQYAERLHSDLPPTTLRGYVQVNPGTDPGAASPTTADNTVPPPPIHYLGPVIVAERNRPVRIKFTNRLPTGEGGDLFIPVDESVMGAGLGPLDAAGNVCDPTLAGNTCARFPQNRATIHLHGGRTPWISDGTPHQWVVPVEEATPYRQGVSTQNVPDMPDPGPGSMTFYYSNQQSARLMFYHDHAFGITRLNVYAGMAAGYLVTDQWERELVTAGVLPAEQIPLILEDKTFVDAAVIRDTDPTWNWGTGAKDPVTGIRAPRTGDLWLSHVYMPAQNPYDLTGTNPFGRWVYGPWFWPPTNNILHGPVANPYHDPNCSSTDPALALQCTTPGQPPVIPGTPHPSVGMENFLDTAVVNGTAFPNLTVQPRAYRFRILNAANARFFNLQLYRADPAQVASDGRTFTEVKTVPAAAAFVDTAAYPDWPIDGRAGGVPDPATQGPSFIQVGTEGGFLPRPVVVPNQPITSFTDPTAFNFGNVKGHALLLGPAERADVVIDFSAYAGQTLILYNDAPAAFPARDPRLDYYTGAPDLSDTGGHTGPQIGFGPNIRTVLRIQVAAAAPAPAFDLAALEAAFAPNSPAAPAGSTGSLFERAQDPIIVGQASYNGIYTGRTFLSNWPLWGVSRIQDTQLSLLTPGGEVLTIPMEPKGMHDEMGASFDKEYGRMSGNLGMEMRNSTPLTQNFVLYGFADRPTEVVNDSIVPLSPVLGDGTQIWKITHNGVDTHPIHFHIFDVQLINRVGWDGQIRLPDATELGWKDTIRISPLEDTIVAIRPYAPAIPFGVPDSVRPLNPALPLGSAMGFVSIDPNTGQATVPPVTNEMTSFRWEYVWHCHILSHEEMDMMRPIILNYENLLPAAPVASVAAPVLGQVRVSWTDPTPVDYLTHNFYGDRSNEIGFDIERSADGGATFAHLAYARANTTTFDDASGAAALAYVYRVGAYNAAGTTWSAPTAAIAFVAPVPGVSPAALAFGDVLVGATASRTVTLRNTGNANLDIAGIALGGADAAQFTQVGTCGASLGPAQSCTVEVTFAPAGRGARAASLTIQTNAPVNGTVAVALGGTSLSSRLTTTPSSLLFLNQTVAVPPAAGPAQTVTLANGGVAPVTGLALALGGADAAEFTLTTTCGAALAAGATCDAQVAFAPASSGQKAAALSIAAADGVGPIAPLAVPITGWVGPPIAAIAPASLTFPGTRLVGAPGAAQTVVLSNSGASPLAISAVTVTGEFAVADGCGASLAAGASCNLDVTFAPATGGTKTGSLAVASSDPTNPLLSVALGGLSSAVGLAPLSLALGDQPVGTNGTAQVVTLTNAGSTPLTGITLGVAGASAGDFLFASGCGASLPAGSSCTVSVQYAPAAAGPSSATLSILSSDPAAPHTVALSGTGTVPVAGVAPAALAGLTSPLNVASPPQLVTLSNTGLAPMSLTSVSIAGVDATQFAQSNNCPAALPAGGSCEIQVTFLPTRYRGTLTKTATLDLAVAAPAVAQSVALTGTIVAPTFTLTPAALAFGKQPRNTASPPQQVVLLNTGTAALSLRGITLGGANATSFAQTNDCGVGVAAGASCTITVTFRPTRAGARTATLNVRVTAPAVSQSVALSGSGQ